MRLFTNIFLHKMETRHFKGKLYLSVLIFLVLLNYATADSRTHIPARVLAKQTGATQFEEERYETAADCNEHKHHLKKRASDEDVDYEVYQGVVGRPGIDFPIYPRIPKTTFSCRSYGNGYFADMETDCQVFHICEEGRKISFLCPNGTIFQQSELTCDWWFKVNCLGSSGFYADSTELLNKQRVQRLKPSIPVQGFNIVGGGLNIKPRVPANTATSRSRGGNINDDTSSDSGKSHDNGGGSGGSGSGHGKGHGNQFEGDVGGSGGKGKGNAKNYGIGKDTNNNGKDANETRGSSVYTQANDKGNVGNRGPESSNVPYKTGKDGPGVSNSKYNVGSNGPAGTNDRYHVGKDGQAGPNDRYHVGKDGQAGPNERYHVGKDGQAGPNERYHVGKDGYAGPNDRYHVGKDGYAGPNDRYNEGSNGPAGSNVRYHVGKDGPAGSNDRYHVGKDGPNSRYHVGNDGPAASNIHYKTGRDGPSASGTRGGNIGSGSGGGSSGPSASTGFDDSNSFVHSNSKSDRRIDSAEAPSVESIDFDDLSGEKLIKGSTKPDITTIDTNDNNDNDESQITAESASFVSNRNRNTYNQEKTKPEYKSQDKQSTKPGTFKTEEGTRRGAGDRGSQRHGYVGLSNDSSEKRRPGTQRGNQRYREDKKTEDEHSFNSSNEKSNRKDKFPDSYEKSNQATTTLGAGTDKSYKKDKSSESSEKDGHSSFGAGGTDKSFKKEKIVESGDKHNHPTPSYVSGTYTTARRLDSTRTTPFYTPTVPSIIKGGKNGEGKSYNSKEGTATTPQPHRLNINNNGPGLFLDEGGSFKPTPNPKELEITGPTTIRPIIIGMRHHYDDRSSETLSGRKNANLDLTLPSNHKNYEEDDLSYATTPASTGPTYLPKSGSVVKSVHGSNGDSLLFAPIKVPQDDQVSRNVNDMLKTMNVLKHNFEDVELVKTTNGNGNTRTGLEIPPSSGPDALISLAKYFATEEDGNGANKNANSLGSGGVKKSETKGATSGTASSHFSATGSGGSASSSQTGKTSASGSVTTHSGADANVPQSRNSLTPKEKPSDTTATLTTESPASLARNAGEISSSLLSNNTVNKYNSLFGLDSSNNSNTEANLRSGLADPNAPKTQDIVTSFPQIGPTDATIRVLATKPESRKIAQVFSNALNDYLNDPVKFRDELRSARPTEPPVDKNFNFVSVTDPTLFNHGTAATYLPTVAPVTGRPFSTTESNLASVINSNLITSTGYPDLASTTEVFDATTFKTSAEQIRNLEFSAELEPPSPDSGEGEELLQREHTQSFAKNRNDLLRNADKSGKLTTGKPTEKPWSFIEDEDVLDPLKINNGLMKKPQPTPKVTTGSPGAAHTHTPKTSHTTSGKTSQRGQSHSLTAGYTGRSNSHDLQGHGDKYRSETADPWADIFESYDLSRESLPTTTGLQRIANKLFGGLNENEALHLKNVMAEAEHNRQILRLLLLLIQTCDDNNGKALERSRKSLLNALISMDGKLSSDNGGKSSHTKEKTLTTTEKLPVTTYRRTGSGEEITTSTLSYPSTTTDLATTTLYGSTTNDATNSAEATTTTTKFAIIVDDIDNDTSTSTSSSTTETGASAGSSGSLDSNSDKRALELLKSLYSLASKFTSRR